ncbi:acyl-CoA mutase large subunit family protein [Aquibacillus sediminis]|uniref:acyl-CoA mutase large subunit family protein n=1 Tax=Aquibacillus sediminis TaxID=2574734 RepID=UPI001109CC34|nr:methylmalonyl-CoA mutase family protein [Aquibacillus sediminis]
MSRKEQVKKIKNRKKFRLQDKSINRKYVYGPQYCTKKDLQKIGFPGCYPYTRGIYPTMYCQRLWSFRQYAGFGSSQDTNNRFHYLLSEGQTALSVAFDLPTQLGMDSDHSLAEGEVGKVGVAIDTLADMEKVFKSIPLDQVSTSMTINAPAAILLCMYVAVAEKQGVDSAKLKGTVQNDILKEYIARGTYIFPPIPSIRLFTNILQFCEAHLPHYHPISISGYHMRESGATAAQEIAYTFANAKEYLNAGLHDGLEVDQFAPRMSFFFSAHSHVFEEIAKFRAARRIWASIMKNEYKAKNPNSMKLRFHTQTAGSTLSSKEPLNNITRVTLQALTAILGGTQSLHTNGWDEAYTLPNKESAQQALRIQQILAKETGVTETVDPLGGSYYVEALTDQLEEQIYQHLNEIDQIGGAIKATETGFFKHKIQQQAYQDYQKQVSMKQDHEYQAHPVHFELEQGADPQVQKASLLRIKQQRSTDEVRTTLAQLEQVACQPQINLMPYILRAVKAYCTIGEICDVLRKQFGEYKERL